MDTGTALVILLAYIVGLVALLLLATGIVKVAEKIPGVKDYLDRTWPE